MEPMTNDVLKQKELEKEQAFALVVAAGEIQLQSGAEITRVEETMNHMARALELDSLETYVIANGIFATAEGTEHMQRAGLKHISTGDTDLRKIEEINSLSRHLEERKLTMEQAWVRIEEIRKLGDYPAPMLIAAYAVGAGCFCYALGGTGNDAISATIVGLSLGVFFHFLKIWQNSKALRTILGSILVSFLALTFHEIGIDDNVNWVIIGGVIPMIPGVSFTSAIRDLVENDYVSGLIRMMDVLLTLCCIVIGVVLVWELPWFARF